MARTKGSKNGVRKPKSTSNRMVAPYVFRNGDAVIYKGGLWEEYSGEVGIVERCYLEKRHYKWYKIRFDDGKVISVKEEWIGNQGENQGEMESEVEIGSEIGIESESEVESYSEMVGK
jgi:hypothetical protein